MNEMKIFVFFGRKRAKITRTVLDFLRPFLYTVDGELFTEVTYMAQNNKNNVWKIVLISLGVAAVVAAGVVILIKVIKNKKAQKALLIEWDDEEAFEQCLNGQDDCEIVIVADTI